MNLQELAATDEAKLVDLLGLSQHVMSGLVRTLLLVSKTISGPNHDGAELTREAAEMIASMLLAEAAEARKAGEIAEAEIRERAVEQFKMVIRETFGPGPRRQ
jgi:hypothetical protein